MYGQPERSLFFGTSGPRDAAIMLVGEAWGRTENDKKRPFVGQSGIELDRILAEVGIPRSSCFATNLIAERPPNNDLYNFFYTTVIARKEDHPLIRGLYPKANVRQGLEILRQQIEAVKPKLIIALGNYALWALTEDSFFIKDEYKRKVPTGIVAWRGSQLYTRPDMGNVRLLPTFHPAAILRTWPWRYDIVHDLRARVPRALNDQWDEPHYLFEVRPSFEHVVGRLDAMIKLADKRADPLELACDIETKHRHISCIGFAWSTLHALCIPFVTDRGTKHYFSEDEEFIIHQYLRAIFRHPNISIIGQNFLYDAQYIASDMAVIPRCNFDTMLIQHLCWPGRPKGLAYISALYNHWHRYWKAEGKEWHPRFSDEQHWVYNCRDCVSTYESAQHLRHVVQQLSLDTQCAWQMQQFSMVLDMMLRGVLQDDVARARLSIELLEQIQVRNEFLEKIIPEEIYPRKPKASPWYTSPQQMTEVFYDILAVKEIKHKKTKKPTTNADALITIGTQNPVLRPITDTIAEIRTLKIFRTNFIRAPLDIDKRLRCFFDPSGTNTFRWNSSENAFGTGTNLQTIPKGKEEWE